MTMLAIDVYRLGGDAPVYESFIRTSGYWMSDVVRQGNTLFISSGEYGVETVTLPAR